MGRAYSDCAIGAPAFAAHRSNEAKPREGTMSKRADAKPASTEVARELQQTEALLKSGAPGFEALNIRAWYDAFREASSAGPSVRRSDRGS